MEFQAGQIMKDDNVIIRVLQPIHQSHVSMFNMLIHVIIRNKTDLVVYVVVQSGCIYAERNEVESSYNMNTNID